MPTTTCDQCGNPTAGPATNGRRLCAGCLRKFGTIAGAATALASGQGPDQAIVVGIATGGYIGAVEADRVYQRDLKAKVAATDGFWRRMWVRIVG